MSPYVPCCSRASSSFWIDLVRQWGWWVRRVGESGNGGLGLGLRVRVSLRIRAKVRLRLRPRVG